MTYREIIRYLDKAFLKIRATQKSATISNVFQSVEDITATIVKNTHQQYKALIRVLKDNSTTTSLEHSQIAVETKILLNNFNKALRKSLDENTLPIAENKVIVEMVMKALKLQPAPQSHIIIEFFNGIFEFIHHLLLGLTLNNQEYKKTVLLNDIKKSIKKSLNYHLSENLEFNVDDLQEDDAFILVNTPQQMKDEIISTAKSYHLAECFAHFLAYQTAKSRLSNSPIIEINMQGNQPLKFAWNFFNCHQLSGALKATVFIPTQDTQHDSAYVAWTGTMDLPTLLADMQCNPGETDYDQAKEIISENILECLKIAHKRKLKLEFVGHSLGGSFAQYSTNTALTLCLKYDLPVAIKMTVFNSPGVSKTAYKESIALAHELSARGFPAIEACFVVKDKDIVQRAGFCKLFQGINPELVNISMAKINPTLPSNLIAAHRFKLNSYALTINPNTESTAIVTIDPQANFYIGIRCNDDEKTKICLAESLRKHSAVLRWLTSVASFPAVIGRFFITAHHPSRLLQKPLALSTDDSHEDGFCRVEQSVLPQTPLFFSSIRGSGGICSANPTP